MSTDRPHPFPPLLRWLLFPTLAATAGGAAGLGTAWLSGSGWVRWEWVAVSAPMSVGGALGFALPGPRWIGPIAAPLLNFAAFCSAYALYSRLSQPGSPYVRETAVLELLLSTQLCWAWAIWLWGAVLAVAHRLCANARSIGRGVAVYLSAALVLAVAGPAFVVYDVAAVRWLGLLTAGLQGVVMAVALRLARQRSEAR